MKCILRFTDGSHQIRPDLPVSTDRYGVPYVPMIWELKLGIRGRVRFLYQGLSGGNQESFALYQEITQRGDKEDGKDQY